MKKSLFISALVAFVMMFCVNVNAQEKATGKAYKDLKKQEKVLDKDLQKKAIKEARKEAKKLEKERYKYWISEMKMMRDVLISFLKGYLNS